MPQLKLKGVKFILPTAEERSISINGTFSLLALDIRLVAREHYFECGSEAAAHFLLL
jgi:hypothetical protein